MDTQMVSTTYLQRNFRSVWEMEEPVVVMRDSKPEKVLIDYDDYMQMKKRDVKAKDGEFFAMLDKIHARNAHIPEKDVERDVEKALKYVRSRRIGH